MIFIGEKINSSIPASKAFIEARNDDAICALAKAQREAGADFIDINAGAFLAKEAEYLAYLARTVEALGMPLSVDTPSVPAARAALEAASSRGHLINSVTTDETRLSGMGELAVSYGCGVVALCSPNLGEENTLENRLGAAQVLVKRLTAMGIAEDGIYLDPMLGPVGAEPNAALDALETIRRLRAEYPSCHISCGLSNLSFGLPKRRLLGQAFLAAAVVAGLDAAIADPLNRELMGIAAASEVIAGRDEYCMEYIEKCRGGQIG